MFLAYKITTKAYQNKNHLVSAQTLFCLSEAHKSVNFQLILTYLINVNVNTILGALCFYEFKLKILKYSVQTICADMHYPSGRSSVRENHQLL